MTTPFHLQPLLNLAQNNNESATRRLGQLNKLEHDAQTQLNTLLEYRKDYLKRLQTASTESMDPAILRNFQEFIYKLDAAIAQQMRAVEQSRLSTQAGRNDFSTTQRKLKSFDTLQQRHIETQSKAEAKLELRAMDEHTGRATTYKMQKSEDQPH
ncbi:MAG: flagellar export protein FliJ [Gallionellales bacterium RIFOXYB12_FULL_54_9]|nr:MAG: flagellar export protein FliJ [Gallionellales bacterium RIFOXYB12_FULL_54_9]